jgi:hypothetical protein
MALTPTNAPDSLIKELFGDNEGVAKAAAAAMERLLNVMPGAPQAPVADLLFSVPHKRRNMVYVPVPVGHDVGYRCWDGDKHDADSAFESGEYGDGMSENEAYVAWLRNDCPSPCDCSDPFCEDHDRRTQTDIENERAVDDALHEEAFGDGN